MRSTLDMVREAVTPELVSRMSGLVGETPAATRNAFSAAVPAILTGAAQAAATPGGAERLHGMITGGGYGEPTLTGLGRLVGGRGGSELMHGGSRILTSLFGARADTLAGALADFAALRRGSASSLLALAAPVAMSVLGKQIAARGLDATGLMSLLADQRSAFESAIPAGLSSLLGERWAGAPGVSAAAVPPSTTAAERDRFGEAPVAAVERAARAWAVTLGLLAALAWLLLFSREPAPDTAQMPGVSPGTEAPAATIRESASLALPDGRRLSVNPGGFLDQLGTFLRDAAGAAPPRRFVVDDLSFEPGSTTLTWRSRTTVDAVAAILKPYPTVQVALEAHTDATGDAAANRKLSLERAEAIKALLVEAGIGAERIRVVGHGPERPVASNDTEDGRARNRRTELVVLRR